jgi:hypothetical protein
MSNFNIGGGSSDLTDGTANINVASVSISSLTPSTTIKTDLSSKIISSALDISDVSGLQTALDAAITNPYIGTLQATDFASDNVGSYDDKIPEIEGEILTKLSKTDTADQSFVSNLTLTDDTKKISAVNIEMEEITTPNSYLNITGTISQTGNQYYIENTENPANNFRINMFGESGTELEAQGGSFNLKSEAHDIVIQGNNLEVDCPLRTLDTTESTLPTNGSITTEGGLGVAANINCGGDLDVGGSIKLNSTILDSNDDESYILKKESGNNSYSMGKNVFCGSGISNLAIGTNVGNANDTCTETVLIGYNVGNTTVSNFNASVCIGANTGNKLTAGGNVFIGRGVCPNNPSDNNTCIGHLSGHLTTGSRITALGSNSAYTTGTRSTHIGYNAKGVDGLLNQISLGYQAITTAANQCVIGDTDINQFLSDGFRDLDAVSPVDLRIGKTNATKVEIGKSGAITEVKGNLNVGGTFNGLTPIGGVFSQIATKTNTETGAVSYVSLISTGVGSLTVPANTFKVGDTYSLKLSGVKTNGNNNQLTIRLVSGAVLLATTGAIVLPGLSATPYELEVEFTIRAIGGAGTAYMVTSGNLGYTDTGVYKGSNFNSLNTTTFNTTISNTLGVEALQSTVSNVITCSQLVLTKIF